MKTFIHGLTTAFAAFVLFAGTAQSADLAKDFVITNRETGKEIRRADFKNKILVLDFFAYWCGPCEASSSLVEKKIAKYYKRKGGNPHGLEVVVIGVNVESNNSDNTEDFISKVGFETVADDFGASGGALAQFGTGGVPHFVIMNGTSGGSHKQWEVLHSEAGFRGTEYYRQLIDEIKAPTPTREPEIRVEQPRGRKLVDGSVTRDFGKRRVGAKAVVKTFTIKNTGNAKLKGLRLVKGGAMKKDFSAGSLSATSLAAGEKTTFKVRFSPKGRGKRVATLKIRSNDADEDPFNIRLSGRGAK